MSNPYVYFWSLFCSLNRGESVKTTIEIMLAYLEQIWTYMCMYGCGLSHLWLTQKCNINLVESNCWRTIERPVQTGVCNPVICMSNSNRHCNWKSGCCMKTSYRRAICDLKVSNARISRITWRYKGLDWNQTTTWELTFCLNVRM